MKRKTILSLFAVLAAIVLLTLACGGSVPEAEEPQEVETEEAVETEAPEPVETEAPTEAPAQEPSCYRWDEVTLDMADSEVCVYGVAYSEQGQSRVDFSEEKNSFFLIDTTHYYPELGEGVCLYTTGMIQVFDGKIPYIDITNGKLYKCEPWMEE